MSDDNDALPDDREEASPEGEDGAPPDGDGGASRSRPAGPAVRIRDLSGGVEGEALEVVRGFETVEHAGAFARRYVRDSVEHCRGRGMDADAVLAAWFAYGEDADVLGPGGEPTGWSAGMEVRGFVEAPPDDPEERDWRALDPRRDGDDAPADEEDPEEGGRA